MQTEEIMKMKEFIYIYNLQQANFYLQNGVIPVEIAKSELNGRTYAKFKRSETKQIFDKWCLRNKS